MRKKQSGLSLIGMLILGVIAALIFILAMRCVPIVNEYFAVKKIINQIAESGLSPDTSVSDIRRDFDLRAAADYIDSVKGADLAVVKRGGNFDISVAYERTVPIVANVSLLFQFDTHTGGNGR